LVSWCKKVVGKCKECSKSQAKKDAERHVAEVEAMGQENTLWDEDVSQAHEPESEPISDCCCMYRVLCKIPSLLLNQNEQDPCLLLNSRVHSYVWLFEVKKIM